MRAYRPSGFGDNVEADRYRESHAIPLGPAASREEIIAQLTRIANSIPSPNGHSPLQILWAIKELENTYTTKVPKFTVREKDIPAKLELEAVEAD